MGKYSLLSGRTIFPVQEQQTAKTIRVFPSKLNWASRLVRVIDIESRELGILIPQPGHWFNKDIILIKISNIKIKCTHNQTLSFMRHPEARKLPKLSQEIVMIGILLRKTSNIVNTVRNYAKQRPGNHFKLSLINSCRMQTIQS